ncbi:hypothetical protein AAC387_Pa03g1989 [Persea americana]
MRRFSSATFGISPATRDMPAIYRHRSPNKEKPIKNRSESAAHRPPISQDPSTGDLASHPSKRFNFFSGLDESHAHYVKKPHFFNDHHRNTTKSIDLVHVSEVLQKKDWFILLNHAFDSTKTNLNTQSVVRVLQNQENPLMSLKFYIWVSNINPELSKNQSVRRLLSDVLFRKGPVILSIELLQEIREAGCCITEELFCILIGSWGRLGLAKYSTEVFGQMAFLGFKPSTRVYNSVIDALVKSNSLDLAYFKFQQMAADNCYPDRFTYNILIHGVCKLGIVEEALRLLKQMENSGHLPNVFTYTMLIDGFCNAKKSTGAWGIPMFGHKDSI